MLTTPLIVKRKYLQSSFELKPQGLEWNTFKKLKYVFSYFLESLPSINSTLQVNQTED